MFKKSDDNWLKQEYEQEKRNNAKVFGRPAAQTESQIKNLTERPGLYTPEEMRGKSSSLSEKSGSKEDPNFLKMYLLKKVFGIFGFLISWVFLTFLINFFVQRYLFYFFYIPDSAVNVVIFFVWGFVFLILRNRVFSSGQ